MTPTKADSGGLAGGRGGPRVATEALTFGSLFAGIGGMDLGLERAGLTCRWQVEIDPYCRRVLAKHWPDVPRHDDVKTFPPQSGLCIRRAELGADRETSGAGAPWASWRVDIIAGGFPCQDVSQAGKRAGIDGARSGLWSEFARIIRVLRPAYVLVENVPGLLTGGLGRVLGDLAALGYDAEWESLPAAAFGADHIRQRVFLMAYGPSPGREAGESLEGRDRQGVGQEPQAEAGGRAPS